jgi:hypothetical protein
LRRSIREEPVLTDGLSGFELNMANRESLKPVP